MQCSLICSYGRRLHLTIWSGFAAPTQARGRFGGGQVWHQRLSRCLVSFPVSQVRQRRHGGGELALVEPARAASTTAVAGITISPGRFSTGVPAVSQKSVAVVPSNTTWTHSLFIREETIVLTTDYSPTVRTIFPICSFDSMY
jgi:hypothetical protein